MKQLTLKRFRKGLTGKLFCTTGELHTEKGGGRTKLVTGDDISTGFTQNTGK